MKKVITLCLLCLILCTALLSSCDKYHSSFRALMCVESHNSYHSTLKFSELDGIKVFKMKTTEAMPTLYYAATVESGSVTVYCDYADEKVEWFRTTEGETVSGLHEPGANATVYVIIETNGTCKEGEFLFEIGS